MKHLLKAIDRNRRTVGVNPFPADRVIKSVVELGLVLKDAERLAEEYWGMFDLCLAQEAELVDLRARVKAFEESGAGSMELAR